MIITRDMWTRLEEKATHNREGMTRVELEMLEICRRIGRDAPDAFDDPDKLDHD